MSLDQCREYLARVLPWPQDETTSFVNVHWTFVPKDLQPGRKLPWTGRAVRNLAEAAKAVAWAQKSADTRDIYVCQSTQLTGQEVVTEKGWKYFKPVRLAENAVAMKAIWLDLDAKGAGKNSYDTVNEAVAALSKFRADTGLPKPSIIVGSGGGMHVYWVFNRALTVAEWYPLAAALSEATTRHGLKVDSISTDAARVLRIPDTANYKTTPPRPVKILARTDFDYSYEKLNLILEPYKVAGAVLPEHLLGFATHLPRLAPIKDESELASGIELGMGAEEIRACLDVIPNGGTDWNAWNTVGMRIFAACEGADYGLAEWQRWSDQVTTEGKDSCAERWQVLQSSPPTRTGAGALVNAARAATGDPQWQARSSTSPSRQTNAATPAVAPSGAAQSLKTSPNPIGSAATATAGGLLGATTSPSPAPAAAPDPLLPHGYSRDKLGIIWQVSLDDDGNTLKTPISEYPMTEPMLQKDPRLLHFTTTVDRGREQRIDLPLELVGTNEMRKYLQSQGFMLRVQPKLATEFFLSWIKKLQDSKDAVSSSPFGWNVYGGKTEGFVYGGREFTGTGDKPAAAADPVLARQYNPTGTIEPWLAAAKMVTLQGRPALEAIVASAFAAPLVAFTGHRGMLMSIWSQESGVGKTTGLSIAQAVWGSPARAVQQLDDTTNSVMGKIGQIQSLPLYWDELKTEDQTKKFVNLTFQITGGREKTRMTQSAKQREAGAWKTLLICASNDSLMDYIVQRTSTTPAGLLRLFEFEIPPGEGCPGQIDPSTAQRIVSVLDHNYGQVGLMYAKFLGTNSDRVNKEVGRLSELLNTELMGTQEERFWIGLIAVMLLGARYANELGVIKFDIPGLKKFLVARLADMRAERREQPVDMKIALNVSNVLASFLNGARHRHMIITNRIPITAGKPVGIKVLNGEAVSRMDGIYVHAGAEDKLLRISSTYFSEWLHEKGYSRPVFTRALVSEFGMKRVNGKIAAGTSYKGATEYLLEIDMTNFPMINFLD